MIKTIRMSQTFCNEFTKPKVTTQGNGGVGSLVTQKDSLQRTAQIQSQAGPSVKLVLVSGVIMGMSLVCYKPQGLLF